jgi:hypothetical protein
MRRYVNAFSTVIGAALAADAPALTLAPGQGAALAAVLTPGDWLALTLEQGALREIVRIEGVTGDTCAPLVRGQEDTTARAWPIGTRIECRITRASLEALAGVTYTQTAPASTWTIAHNLGYRPTVQCTTLGGLLLLGDVLHLSDLVCQLSFNTPTAGVARLT